MTGRAAPVHSGFAKSMAADERLNDLVPGGAHTYARGSDQYPDGMAPVLTRGAGAHVWDVDGNRYIEYGMGLRSVTLGHGYRPVVDAVRDAVVGGVNFSRPSVWELRAAERFLEQVPAAEMVKFAKNGSDATTAAVRLARAATGRDIVAACTSQPFFSTDDWFIGRTPMSAGIPERYGALTVGFPYNDFEAVSRLCEERGSELACVILEPATATSEPEDAFLEKLRALTTKHGIVLIFDEMITGMRWGIGGGQSTYGVQPDLSTWGKALGNGFAISALAGRRDLMELGGLATDSARAFLLSTTHGPEVVGLSAYLAVNDAYAEQEVVATMERQGAKLATGFNALCEEAGLSDYVAAVGRSSCLVFTTAGPDRRPSQEFRTLFLQEMLMRGVLGQSFVISAAHTDEDIALTLDAAQAALDVYGRAIDAGTVDGVLIGRPVAPAIRKYAAPRRR